ncbi:MAG: hypothetical protein ABIP94_24535 [Planctomycetota bacterium]
MPSSCGAGSPTLLAQPTYDRDLDFLLGGLLPASTSVGVLVLGLAPANVTMPLPPFCLLGTSVDAIGLFVPTPSGTASHHFAMTPWPSGFTFRAQALSFDFATGMLRSSSIAQITKL